MSVRFLVSLGLVLAVTPLSALAQVPAPPAGTGASALPDPRLSEQALLSRTPLCTPDGTAQRDQARERLREGVTLVLNQQQRLTLLRQASQDAVSRLGSAGLNLEQLIAAVQKDNPDINFQDPQVLRTIRTSAASLVSTLGGVLVEPTSIALMALINPELAVRGQQLSLQAQLARRADNAQLQAQLMALQQVVGSGSPELSQPQLEAMQAALKAQNVPIPATPEGGQVLVDQLYRRLADLCIGRKPLVTVDLIPLDPSGVLGQFFSQLDARIAELEANPNAQPQPPRLQPQP